MWQFLVTVTNTTITLPSSDIHLYSSLVSLQTASNKCMLGYTHQKWGCRATTSSLVHYTFDVGAIPNTCTAKSARPSSKNTNCANCHVRATHRLLKKTSPRVIVCKESNATCAHQILVISNLHKKLPVFVFQ